MMNNNNNIRTENKIKYYPLEKRLFPFFIALPQNVPVEWMIPFLFIIEDIQYIPYIIAEMIYNKLRKWIINIFLICNLNVSNSVFYYVTLGLVVLFVIYIYAILIYHIQSPIGKTMSKRKLYLFNSIYLVFSKYLLTFVFNFLTKCAYICKLHDTVSGIPQCDSASNKMIVGITTGCIVLIVLFSFLYSNYNFNINCLSHAKLFGSFHKANANGLILSKLLFSLFKNVFPNLFISEVVGIKNIPYIIFGAFSLIFLYLAYFQLIYQPFYSNFINNYRFSVYFGIGGFSLYNIIVHLLNLNSSQIIADISVIFLIILFISGYFFNSYYHKKTLNRIYRNFREKNIMNLSKSTSNDKKANDPIKKTVYQSVERITTDKFIKKEIKVFKNYYECEMACRFIRRNRNIEAFLLMRKIYEEGMSQFKNKAEIYIMAWYYIHSMKKFYKDNNLLQKYDIELFKVDSYLSDATDLKLDIRKRFLINEAENIIDIEKKESALNVDSKNIEASLKLQELKLNLATMHLESLREIKNLYSKLSNSTNVRDVVNYIGDVTRLCKVQNSTSSEYKSVLRNYPDNKDVLKFYYLFLTDVMSNEELAFKYFTKINNDKSSENVLNKSQGSNSNTNIKDKKAIAASSNSLVSSVPYSEDYSTASGMGREMHKKINAKNSMLGRFIMPIRSYKLEMNLFVLIFIVLYVISGLVTRLYCDSGLKACYNLSNNIDIPGIVMQSTYESRIYSMSIIANDYDNYMKYKTLLLNDSIALDAIYVDSLQYIMDEKVDLRQLLVPIGMYSYDSYESNTLTDTYRRFVSAIKFIINKEMLYENDTATDILYEPHFRYFMINSKKDLKSVFNDYKNISKDKLTNLLNQLEYINITFEVLFIITIFIIIYITYGPFKKSTKKITCNILQVFKYLSKKNFEEVIDEYDCKIESICENFDLDKDLTESGISKDKKYTIKTLLLGISFFIIFSFIFLASFTVFALITELKRTTLFINQAVEIISTVKGIQLYTHEILHQDRTIFIEKEPERILHDLIYQLEEIQSNLKSGDYGGPNYDSYPVIDHITKNKGCFELKYQNNCDPSNYDSTYGFTEEVATLPLNELLREYLFYIKNFIDNVNDEKYIKLPFVNKENIQILYQQEVNDNFFKFQEKIVNNIIGSVEAINQNLMEYLDMNINSNKENVTVFSIVTSILLVLIDIFVFNNIYEEKVKEMNALVSFVFLMPKNIVNKNDKFKKFLETGSFDN